MYSLQFVLLRSLQHHFTNLFCPIFNAFPWHLRAIHHLHQPSAALLHLPLFWPTFKGLLCSSKTRHFPNRIILSICCFSIYFFNHKTLFFCKQKWENVDGSADIKMILEHVPNQKPPTVIRQINKTTINEIFKMSFQHETEKRLYLDPWKIQGFTLSWCIAPLLCWPQPSLAIVE